MRTGGSRSLSAYNEADQSSLSPRYLPRLFEPFAANPTLYFVLGPISLATTPMGPPSACLCTHPNCTSASAICTPPSTACAWAKGPRSTSRPRPRTQRSALRPVAPLGANGCLKDIYAPVDENGKERKPSLEPYPAIPWNEIDLDQFDMVPKFARPLLKRYGSGWQAIHVIPMESGRGCPYGCEFCTVTGFFGDSIRFRSNESVVQELLALKKNARENLSQVIVFFIDDNFAINIKRTKSLLRDIIAAERAGALDGANKRQSVARRGAGGFDCGIRW